jgi:hypothetical protein
MKISPELKNRLKTFAWSLFWVAIAAVADYTLSNLGLFNMPEWVVGIIGLSLAQVSKYAHNRKAGTISK